MLGFDRISVKYKAELPRVKNTQFDFTDCSFNDIIKSTETRALKVIRPTGGRVNGAAWTWTGEWKDDRGTKRSEAPGNETEFKFDGVAVAVIGGLNQLGGRADVYLDGVKQMVVLDAYIATNTHDNVLWQAYGLKPGPHTLRIVTSASAVSRSSGKQIAIRKACVYRAGGNFKLSAAAKVR